MSKPKLFYHDAKMIRDHLNKAIDIASQIHENESSLVKLLYHIDQKSFYVRYGFNSLTGFCRFGLRFSKTQTQRIVTQVRRHDPTANFREKDYLFELNQ